MQKPDKDPTEMVSCGQCGAVNNVPFGLDRFKCYSCSAMVSIARELSAACGPASETARQYDALQRPGTGGGSSTAPPPVDSKKSDSFFGKLQKGLDKTMQKVERAFQAPATPAKPTTASARTEAQPLTSISEEDQIQWALRSSLEESNRAAGGGSAAVVSAPTVARHGELQKPEVRGAAGAAAAVAAATASAPAAFASVRGSPAGDHLQGGAVQAQAAQRLRDAEDRALRAERELDAARSREAAAAVERDALRRQLAETERLVAGLAEQLDVAHAQREDGSRRCQALERALEAAGQAASTAGTSEEADDAELEHQGTVAQLLARIAQLESTLLQATHFAPPRDPPSASPQACSAAAESPASSVSPSVGPAAFAAAAECAEARGAEAPPASALETAASASGEAALAAGVTDRVAVDVGAASREQVAGSASFAPPPRSFGGSAGGDGLSHTVDAVAAAAGEAAQSLPAIPAADELQIASASTAAVSVAMAVPSLAAAAPEVASLPNPVGSCA